MAFIVFCIQALHKFRQLGEICRPMTYASEMIKHATIPKGGIRHKTVVKVSWVHGTLELELLTGNS